MKIVITGGCGYIGSHIARAFKQHSSTNQVYVVDRERREHTLKGIDGFLHQDFVSKQSLMWITELEPNVIVHCAGDIQVGESVLDPAKYYDNNVSKTIVFLNHLKSLKRIPTVLFSSSASVYGNPAVVPVTEQSPIQPISPYGQSKAVIERVLADYSRAYGMSSVCFRYFNACGAEPNTFDLGQEAGAPHIIARILEAKISKNTFTLNGNDYNTPDRTCIRDYIHVWDLADAHIRATAYVSSKAGVAEVFNLGTKQGISNQQIINYVKEKYGDIDIAIGARREGDPDMLVADADSAQNKLGWAPNYSTIDKIVDSVWNWYHR